MLHRIGRELYQRFNVPRAYLVVYVVVLALAHDRQDNKIHSFFGVQIRSLRSTQIGGIPLRTPRLAEVATWKHYLYVVSVIA